MFRRVVYMIARFIVLASIVGGVAGCDRGSDSRVDFLTDTEPRPYDGTAVPEERIAELREEIRRYEDAVEEMVQNYGRIASYQKLLAHELIQAEMYGPALEALERAMDLQPENPVLFYFAGVASARTARGHILDGEETRYLDTAERLFSEALELRPDYKDALFGMAVLLAFDLNETERAVEYSRRLFELETGDPSVAFLHANVLVRNGRIEEAIAIYDDLAGSAPGADQRQRARENRDALLGGGE
ncbi:MAG: hypothetical protein ACLFSV_05015 [Alkalispirochaeta sp.]